MRIIRTMLAALAISLALPAHALTTAQMTALRALADADPTAVALMQAGDDIGLAAWFNTTTTCIVWRNDVSIAEANGVVVWNEVDGLTVGRARIWDWMRQLEILDARNANIRDGLNNAFTGAGAAGTRTALLALIKRSGTRAEKQLSSGSCSDASPSVMTFVGAIGYAEASLIRAL